MGRTQSKVSASQRTLTLMLNLVNTQLGLSREQLLEVVPGYPAGEGAATRMFERDIDALRDAGFHVTLSGDVRPRYRIAKTSFADTDGTLSAAQAALILKGASAWQPGGTLVDTVLNKLRGHVDQPLDVSGGTPSYNLELGPRLQPLVDAIALQQPVSFEYASKARTETRDVAPLHFVSRRQALYLWGFDLNRWGQRLFRLSRFRSDPVLIAEAGSVIVGEDIPNERFDASRFLVEPLLAVSEEKAPRTWALSEPTKQRQQRWDGADITVPDGWQIRLGREDDIAFWEQLILQEAEGAVVLKPSHLAAMLQEKLAAAAGWQFEDGDGANG